MRTQSKDLSYFGLILISSILSLSSCTTGPVQDESFDPQMCNEQMGYERGMNDGKSGYPMNSKFSLNCRDDLREKTQAGYRNGYQAGNKQYEENKARMQEQWAKQQHSKHHRNGQDQTYPTQPQNSGGNINISIGGTQNTGGDPAGGTAPASANPKAYFCSVKAFTQTFEAFGPTQLEARKQAQDNCSARYHPMHCENVQCQRNE